MSASKPTKPFVDIDRMGTVTRLAMTEGPVNVFIFSGCFLSQLVPIVPNFQHAGCPELCDSD